MFSTHDKILSKKKNIFISFKLDCKFSIVSNIYVVLLKVQGIIRMDKKHVNQKLTNLHACTGNNCFKNDFCNHIYGPFCEV